MITLSDPNRLQGVLEASGLLLTSKDASVQLDIDRSTTASGNPSLSLLKNGKGLSLVNTEERSAIHVIRDPGHSVHIEANARETTLSATFEGALISLAAKPRSATLGLLGGGKSANLSADADHAGLETTKR